MVPWKKDGQLARLFLRPANAIKVKNELGQSGGFW
jgi:hypothetical protein